MEQPDELWWLADERAEVAPLGVIAGGAGPGEVCWLGHPTMFAADDVVHLAAPERVVLVDEAILADMIRVFGNLPTLPFAHVTGHERGVGGPGPWPAA